MRSDISWRMIAIDCRYCHKPSGSGFSQACLENCCVKRCIQTGPASSFLYSTGCFYTTMKPAREFTVVCCEGGGVGVRMAMVVVSVISDRVCGWVWGDGAVHELMEQRGDVSSHKLGACRAAQCAGLVRERAPGQTARVVASAGADTFPRKPQTRPPPPSNGGTW